MRTNFILFLFIIFFIFYYFLLFFNNFFNKKIAATNFSSPTLKTYIVLSVKPKCKRKEKTNARK